MTEVVAEAALFGVVAAADDVEQHPALGELCGEVVASLRASEVTIYGRYGSGVASSARTVEVQTRRTAFRPGVGSGGPVRLLSPTEAWDNLPLIYDARRPFLPGTIARSAVWREGVRLRTESSSGAWYVAVHGEPGAKSGTERWFVSDQQTIVVEDFRPHHRRVSRSVAVPVRPGFH
nr:hypothetical protein [Mycobacterium tilburgii]